MMLRDGDRTMNRAAKLMGCVASIVIFTYGDSSALGQFAGAASSSPTSPFGSPGAGAYPFTNPYMNPYLNPYMTQSSIGRTNTLLYLMAAQQAQGGLPGLPHAQARQRSAGAPTSELAASTNRPGGGANRYFSRGPARSGEPRSYFGRTNRYYANNGR
jgi:hypothetical protein